jgi:hypothetical protein
MGSDRKGRWEKRELRTRGILRLVATLVCSGILSFYVYATSQAGGFSPSELGLNSFLFLGLLYALSLPITWAVALMVMPSRNAGNQARITAGRHSLSGTDLSRRSQSLTQRNLIARERHSQSNQRTGPSAPSVTLAASQDSPIQRELRSGLEELISRIAEAPIDGSGRTSSCKASETFECGACGLEFNDKAAIAAHDDETGHMKHRNKTIVIKSRPIHDAAYRVLSGF